MAQIVAANCYQMLPPKVAYVFKLAKFSLYEYLILFYISIGLNVTQAGNIIGFQNFGGMVGAPLFGLVVDKCKVRRILFLACGILSMVVICFQPILPLLLSGKQGNTCPVNQTLLNDLYSTPSNNPSYLYYSLVVTCIIASLLDSHVMSSIDSSIVQWVKTSPTPSQFSQQRIYGCVGSAFGSISMSLSIKYFPKSDMSCYTGMFITYLSFSLLLLISCYFVFKGLSFQPIESTQDDVTQVLWQSLKDLNMIMFLLSVLVNGIVQATSFTFILIFLKDLGAPTMLLGISMALGSFCSLFTYYYSAKLMKIANGTFNGICISCFAWSVRCMGVAFLHNPFYVLFTDLLNGLSYSFFILCSMEHIKNTCDPRVLTTITGIVNGLHTYVAYAIASFAGGEIYRKYDGKYLFMGISIMSFVWTMVMLCYTLCVNKRPRVTRISHFITAPE